jgi:hypothetical protein
LRKLILAASALAFAASAANAQSSTFAEQMDEDIAQSLPHPFEIEEAGDRMQGAVGAILDMPIGGVVRAIDPTADVRRDDSIADVAGRDDPDFEGRVQDDLRGLTLGMADLVRQMAVVARPRLGRLTFFRHLDCGRGRARRY